MLSHKFITFAKNLIRFLHFMTREEAIAAGMEVHEIQHSMKRRTSWHDYSRKGTYMLTLVVKERRPLLCLTTYI